MVCGLVAAVWYTMHKTQQLQTKQTKKPLTAKEAREKVSKDEIERMSRKLDELNKKFSGFGAMPGRPAN